MSVGVADVSIQETTVNNVIFYFLNFSFSLVSIFLIEGFTQFKNLSSRSLSERPLAYCKTSMAILQPHGGQCGFWASVALQSVQCCRRWVSTSDTSRLVLFFSLLHHQCFSCNGWANQKTYWTKVVGSALYLPLGFSSISKKEAPNWSPRNLHK